MLKLCRKNVQNQETVKGRSVAIPFLHRFSTTFPQRSFLLWEVLIALTLLLLCAYPLSRMPIAQYMAEMRSLESVERQRMADWTFSEVVEQLYSNTLSWSHIPNKEKGGSWVISLPAKPITLLSKTKQITRSARLRCMQEKIDPVAGDLRLIEIAILLDTQDQKEVYPYKIVMQFAP